MSKDPFTLPGSELLNPSVGKGSTPHKELFAKAKGRDGLGRANKPAPTHQEPEEDLIPDAPKPTSPVEPLVKLSNPRFLVTEGRFDDKVPFSVDADLPASLKDVKRVIVTVLKTGDFAFASFTGNSKKLWCEDLNMGEDGFVQSTKTEHYVLAKSDDTDAMKTVPGSVAYRCKLDSLTEMIKCDAENLDTDLEYLLNDTAKINRFRIDLKGF